MKLSWDKVGERFYENGVDHGVLYLPDENGVYDTGVAWNGLTTITESPTGAESNKQYADNIVYLNLLSAEEFGATVEAFTYPDEFAECDGSAVFAGGVMIGQQARKAFGLAYRTKVGNDLTPDAGYKLHLIYNALAAPSEKAYTTINDSPEALAFSWELTTTPVAVGTIDGKDYRPTASLTVDSLKVDAESLGELEDILFGTAGADPRLPLPAEVIALFAGTQVAVETQAPTYNPTTDIITIPTVTGVVYMVNGEVVTGTYGPITEDTVVDARPADGYKFTETSDRNWTMNFS